MTEFVAAALAFPTVLFSFLMLVVLAYWLTVALVGIDFDAPAGETVILTYTRKAA